MSYNYQAPPESYFPTTMEENDDLRWAIDNAPHTVTFWNAVCAYINHEREHGEDPDRVLECPSWGQWRSIGQHLAAGRKDEAVKLLRASTCAWTQVQPVLPYLTNDKWRAFMAANALPAWDHHGGLNLSEAKSIIDTLEVEPHWFGRDTNRVFNSPYVTWAEPVPGGHVPEELKSLGDLLREKIATMREEEPKSLGDLLLEKIAAMREEPPREDPERPEHSLWLNVYPNESGFPTVSRGSRAEADQYASSDRIACLHITFKEGEGL